MNNPSYRIYPTLLDSFQGFLNSDLLWEKFYGDSEDAPYTAEEFTKKQEQDLINHINRVPFTSEPASCGTALNEIVDCIILNKPTEREGLVITHDNENGIINATLDGFSFAFSEQFCREVADYFHECVPQYRCSGILPTKYGPVELYGNIDYLGLDKVFDLKSTSRYDFGKFEDHWQRYTYPYCLLQSADCSEIKEFEFTVCKLRSDKKVIFADFYKEVYTYDHHVATAKLTMICERFIEWLNLHRELITDKKIFGGEND